MEEIDDPDWDIVLIKPDILKCEGFSIFRYQDKEIAIAIECPEYTMLGAKAHHALFSVERSKDQTFLIDDKTLPEGRDTDLDPEEFEAVLTLTTNCLSPRPNGYLIYDALSAILAKDGGYVYDVMRERIAWMAEGRDDGPVMSRIVEILRKRGTLSRAFDERYLVASEPPLHTDDLDEAMLEALRVGLLPIDTYRD